MKNKEEFDEWYKQQNSFSNWVKKYLQPFHIFAVTILVAFAWYLVAEEKVSANWVIICVIGVIVLIIFKGKKQEQPQPIPEPIIKAIAMFHMEERIKRQEYPWGTRIHPSDYCKMQFQGDWGGGFKAWKWAVGFTVEYPDGLKKSVKQLHDVYTGICTGLIRCHEGYDGTQSWDLKVLMPQIVTTKEEKDTK